MALPELVTLYRAQAHVKAVDEDREDLWFKVQQASEIVYDYLKLKAVPEDWIRNTSPLTYAIPYKVQAATLLVLGELYENREASTANVLSEAVQSLLERLRDPALA